MRWFILKLVEVRQKNAWGKVPEGAPSRRALAAAVAAGMTDTHCHLSFSQYDGDRDAVRGRAGIVGVTKLINPGTDLEQSRAAIAVADTYDNVWAGVGVHPQDIGTLTPEAFDAISELAHHPRVVAIGEVGFEISSRSPEIARQEEWLERFIDLAREVEKPLIVHVRNAHAECRRFWEHCGEGVRGVIHCFSGTTDDARFYTDRGLLLGITGIVTFPNASQLQMVVVDIPLEHLLLETDAPFLAPQSHRGKRNEPAYLPEVAKKVAELKGLSVADVERETDANARALFGLS